MRQRNESNTLHMRDVRANKTQDQKHQRNASDKQSKRVKRAMDTVLCAGTNPFVQSNEEAMDILRKMSFCLDRWKDPLVWM